MINFDEYINENKKEHNLNWAYVPDHLYRILIIGGSGSGKTNALLNLIHNQQDIDKIYLYAKDPYEDKYQYLINKRKSLGLKHFNDPKDLLSIQMICMNKILIVFDDIITDMINNKKLTSIVTELFIRARKLNISLVFIT